MQYREWRICRALLYSHQRQRSKFNQDLGHIFVAHQCCTAPIHHLTAATTGTATQSFHRCAPMQSRSRTHPRRWVQRRKLQTQSKNTSQRSATSTPMQGMAHLRTPKVDSRTSKVKTMPPFCSSSPPPPPPPPPPRTDGRMDGRTDGRTTATTASAIASTVRLLFVRWPKLKARGDNRQTGNQTVTTKPVRFRALDQSLVGLWESAIFGAVVGFVGCRRRVVVFGRCRLSSLVVVLLCSFVGCQLSVVVAGCSRRLSPLVVRCLSCSFVGCSFGRC